MNAVITGDIISSTSIPFEERKKLLEIFDKIVNDLQSLCELKCEIFRGDSFQILVEKAELALEVAVLIRAGLKMNTPENSKIIWDARVAIGVGEIEFIDDKVITSDGEAFKYSGRAFDELIKNAQFRYIFLSYNNEGLMSLNQIRDIMQKYGKYDLQSTHYNRFKADKEENRTHKANTTTEYIHILEKY